MSAAYRKLGRLPLEVFEGLVTTEDPQLLSAEELRSVICEKLKRFRVRVRHGGTATASIKTVGELLRVSRRTLLQALDPLLTHREIEVFLDRTCLQCSAKPSSALKLVKKTTTRPHDLLRGFGEEVSNNVDLGNRIRYLPTGLRSLDRDGEGGIRLGNITEVVGRAGAGKTQFALQLVTIAAMLNQGAIYIDTEKKLTIQRLDEIASCRYRRMSSAHQQTGGDRIDPERPYPDMNGFKFKKPGQVLQNMTIKEPNSTRELQQVLDDIEEEILYRNQNSEFPVRLLIVDSIAAPLKRDFGADSAPQRAAAIFSISKTLKRYADQLHLAVVVINQVGLDDQSSSSRFHQPSTQVAVKAALGTSWHHCVSTRLLLDHEVDPHRESVSMSELDVANQSRSLTVSKSNYLPFFKTCFRIFPSGIEEMLNSAVSTEEPDSST